jgi:hypothetical protein
VSCGWPAVCGRCARRNGASDAKRCTDHRGAPGCEA